MKLFFKENPEIMKKVLKQNLDKVKLNNLDF
jgi:hypothetical protein